MLSSLLELLLVLFLGGIATYDTIMSKKRVDQNGKKDLMYDPLMDDFYEVQ